MPIYEYRCSNCGHQQEFLQKVGDAQHTRCTKCGEETFSKMLTAAGFHLKGSGWYATDFKGGGSKAPAKDGADAGGSKAPAKDGADTGGSKAESTSTAAPACGSGACPACQ